MPSLRRLRTAAAGLLLVVLATSGIPAAAGATTLGHQQVHYCKKVDAYARGLSSVVCRSERSAAPGGVAGACRISPTTPAARAHVAA
ncbi:MAG TPA: hypothetical protein VGQ92_09455 [Actinoplanes sp.]|jgi:hypothetical protein|nr:hypothetical protein [Actinoplanes sp.]